MAEVITYSLREEKRRSDHYYEDVDAFTTEVLQEGEARFGKLVEDFIWFVEKSGYETPRTSMEYAFELLTLGVLWRVYGEDARRLSGPAGTALDLLARWRRRSGWLKPVLDPARGALTALFLARPGRSRARPMPPTRQNLHRLLHWLSAAGDFREEEKRLRHWVTFLEGMSGEEVADHLANVTSFAAWFEERSLAVLGRYTPHVDAFLAQVHPRYRWREDSIFCGRQRVEYHLNMVGTEIMNRAFRDGFLETKRKVLLVPPCMRAKSAAECEAVDTPYGAKCGACTPGCRVHQVTKLGEKHGFAVFILPHELNVFSDGKIKPSENGGIGIVGVSCPLTNVTGGWETKDLGVPAQGLLLDYCGCPWHWDLDGGIPTDINFKELLRVMDL